jgi:hypothetical protein
MIYVLTCDDPGLCKAPFVAAKNVSFPDREEIEGIEYYVKSFVWGKLQRTDKRDAVSVRRLRHAALVHEPRPGAAPCLRAREFRRENHARPREGTRLALLRLSARRDALLSHVRDREEVSAPLQVSRRRGLPRTRVGTARAFFTYPYELYPSYYETYKWGLYNELIVLKLADVLDREGFADRAAWLRSEWEKKVKYFVYDDPYPFRSEYAFDRTAFESSYALAKYGATHDMKPDTNLWHDIKRGKWHSHPTVKREDSRAFMERQLAAGLTVRGWLERRINSSARMAA